MKFIILSDDFYARYADCSEILQKHDRPYACLGVRIDGVSYAIPIRHHIHHKYAFKTIGEAGLDYTKAVVILASSDVGKTDVQISRAEWKLIKVNTQKIVREFSSYLKLYKKATIYQDSPHYQNILSNSSLQYFKKYL